MNHLKQHIIQLLKSSDLSTSLEEILKYPARKVINILFKVLYATDEKMKWAAVTAMGAVVSNLADTDMEAARVIMRRFMWNLNDESGGIGWGSPEAMGEIMARHEGLATEYAHILLSYANKDGNFLEHDFLQRGLLWGLGRLATERPQLFQNATSNLVPYLESGDSYVRGLAARIVGLLGMKEARFAVEKLLKDCSNVTFYVDGRIQESTVKDVAVAALQKI